MKDVPVRLRSRTIAAHLERLGIRPEASSRFLDPRLAHLSRPDDMADRQVVAERLAAAIRAKSTIVVFGDYDCDGMTSAAILADVIEELGGRVRCLLASRFAGGYGVSKAAVERIIDERPALLVTCDCGSSDHEALRQVTSAGIDVIVIDHHLVPDEPLPALAFLNPHRPDCGFAFKGLASCGLVLSVAAALRTVLSMQLDVRRWLDLVAVGSIADVAPLSGDNRALVRAGLATLQRGQRPGLAALMDVIGIDRHYPLTAEDVAFRIAPRLNAPGRLQDPDVALWLLREKSIERARDLADEIEHLCRKRRSEQARIQSEAEEQMNGSAVDKATVVVGSERWNHGIVGIVAGRLAEQTGKPTVVVGFDGDVGTGSVRGPDGFPLYDALSLCQPHLVRFGGHQAAAGVTVRKDSFEAFQRAFEEACKQRFDYQKPEPPAPLDVDGSDDLPTILQDLYLLEPCGEGNPLPELRVAGRVLSCRSVKGDHLKLELELPSGSRLSGFGPGLGHQASVSGWVQVVGRLRPDRYRGGDAVEILVHRFQEA